MSGNNSNPSESFGNQSVARILTLLKAGEEKIGSTRIDNAILIVGKSGSGKTTLTHFLTGNNADLVSEELETGDFVIIRNRNENSTAMPPVSKTLPELIRDNETKTVYIECPEFTDGDPIDDISAAYFTKKVIENVNNIKIVMTVNYSSFRSGSDGEDIRNLVERVIMLMKNIDVDSVALVVTEVDNKYKKGVLVPDGVVLENIAKFLSKVREFSKSDKSRKLFDVLLQKKSTEYSRLGIFRRPDAAGPVFEIKLLQDEKKILSGMLENNLEYAKVDSAYVGYTVSDKSKNTIRDSIEEVGNSIAADVSQINDMLIDFFKQLEIDLFDDDIYAVKKHFEAASAILAKIRGIRKSAKASELVSLIEHTFTESWKRASEPILNDMKKLGELMDFLLDVSDKQFDSFAMKWVGELQELDVYVGNSLKWYDFLLALYERLSDYEVQKDTKRFPVPKFQKLQSGYGLLENHADFSKFYSMIGNHRLLGDHYLIELQKVAIDEIRIRYFNKVIESTLLRPSPRFAMFQDQGPRLQVSGEYVKISDVIQHSVYPESKSVQILATHTVFIDADMTKENDISIIAPRWVIIGSRVINLNGSPGEDWSPDKAPDCSYDGCNGLNGSPGKPGRSAGLFFGLGDKFENASQLQIQAVGGTGGDGQRGGDGKKGAPGSTDGIKSAIWNLDCPSGKSCYSKIVKKDATLCNNYFVVYTLYGSEGGRGGDAGRGGAPGIGGFAGNITVLGLGITKPSISQQVTKGNEGKFGLHGTCGEGGEGGTNRRSELCINCSGPDEVYNDEKAPNGTKGVCLYFSSVENSNQEGRANPAAINYLYPPSSTISDFRNELVKDFDNCVRKSHSLIFYRMLQREDVLKYDNIDVIFSEFQQLEQYYNKFPLGLSESLYKFISRRIHDISKEFDVSSNADSSKLLELMSSAVSSKLIRLKKNPHSKLAFNYRDYFDVLKTVNEDKIGRYFIDRANKEIEQTEDIVKIVSSDIFRVAERTISEICNFSPNEDSNKLKRHLLKLKLFSILKLVDDVLDLVTSLTKVDPTLIRITDISAVDGSKIEMKLVAIEETTEKEIDAIKGAMLNEIRSLQSLGGDFDPIVDQLRDVQANLRTRWSIMYRVTATPKFFNVSDEIQTIKGINSALMTNYGPKVNESVINFENAVKVIQWNVDLHDASPKAEFDGTDLISSIDSLRENGINFDKTARDLLDSLKSEIYPIIRMSRASDFYSPENFQYFREAVSAYLDELKLKIHALVSQFGIDEDLPSIVENLAEIFNQLVTILDEVLPAQYTLLNKLRSPLKMQEVSDNHVQNYFTKVISADKLFYDYEHLIDTCKMSIFPFDILINRRLAFPVTPHVDESSMRHQSIIASNIEQLERELNSWEQRINNVTTSEDFNSGNENGAFFVWRYDQYEDSIRKLLRGRAVVLKASLDAVGGDKREWLKFANIGLSFVSTNSTVQQSLDEDLKYFNVSMTHMGDSHFSLCNDVRFVRQDATRFSRNFNETTTQVVDPINSSLKPVLSPFATWIFKLHPIDEDVTFSILKPYRKLPIGIELEGNATFIESVNRTTCQKIVLSDFDIHQFSSKLENDPEVAENISGVDQPPSSTLSSSSVTDQLVSTTEINFTQSATTKSWIEFNVFPPSSNEGNGLTDDEVDVDTIEEQSQEESVSRKRRDISSSSIDLDTRMFNWSNPFNYFFSGKSEPKPELPAETRFLGQNEDHITKFNYCQFLNINGTLALVDFFIRKITKTKPCQSMEKSTSAEEARVIALNIIEELENMSKKLPEGEHVSLSSWQDKDPIEVMCLLEKYIFTGDLLKMKNILVDLIPLDVSDDELDSLLERHLSCAGIRGSDADANALDNLPDGGGHFPGVLNNEFIYPGVISSMENDNLNLTLLN